MGAPGATPPAPEKRALVPLAEQIEAVSHRASVALEPRIAAAMNAAVATLEDYRAMQPKVLALSAVCLGLARTVGMDEEGLNALLMKAEADAKAQLEQAAQPTGTLVQQ